MKNDTTMIQLLKQIRKQSCQLHTYLCIFSSAINVLEHRINVFNNDMY